MDIRFDGKRALVTGAGKGIGRGIAVKLAELGAKVHGISRTQGDLDSLKQEVPGIEVHNVDIADWDRTRAVIESIGPIDLLVNNAGITNWSSFLEVTKDELDNMFGINYKAVFNISQVVAKGMVERKNGGAIVNISSVGGFKAVPNHTIYCSAKGAMDQLTRAMALELGPHKVPSIDTYNLHVADWDRTREVVSSIGPVDYLDNNASVNNYTPFLQVNKDEFDTLFDINNKAVFNISQIRVNSVNPTLVLTRMGKEAFGTLEKPEALKSRIPLRRLAEVEDVVSATLFLLSDHSSMISGIVMPVDGGMKGTV